MNLKQETLSRTRKLHQEGDLTGAIATFQQYLSEAAADAELLSEYGTILHAAGQIGKSEVGLYHALKLDPGQFDVCRNLSQIHREKGEYWAAIEILRAVPDWESRAEILKELGSIFNSMGLFFSAHHCLSRSLALESQAALRPEPNLKTSCQNNEKFYDCAQNETIAEFAGIPSYYGRPPSVTFYIPCYNASDYIEECLRHVKLQTYPILEILVIDDGCSDDTVAKALGFERVKIISHETNRGLAAARNSAFKSAAGEVIAGIDSDVAVSRDWLERLVLNLTKPATAGVGGKLVEAHSDRIADRWRQVHMKQHWGDENRTDPQFLYGSNTIFTRNAVASVGFFDEQLRTNGEDVLISNKLKQAGYALIYEPLAIARHLRTDTSASLLKTAWNWGKPGFEAQGLYANWNRLSQKLEMNPGFTLSKIQTDCYEKRFHLLYLDFMEMVRSTLYDLRYFAEQQRDPQEQVAANQTFIAVKAALRFALRHAVVPKEVGDIAVRDILDIRLNDPQYDCLADHEDKLESLIPVALHTTEVSLRKLGELGQVNHKIMMDVAQQTLSAIGVLSDLHFTMIKASATRVAEEENRAVLQPPVVVLANPPWKDGKRHGVRAGSRWPYTSDISDIGQVGYTPYPFFLGYATALLKEKGICAVMIDAIAEELEDELFFERIRGLSPDILMIESSTPSINLDLRYARLVKLEFPSTFIVLTGPHPTVFHKQLLEENWFVDAVARQEYDETLVALACAVSEGKPWSEIKGLSFREATGRVKVNSERPLIPDIDTIPWPERDSLAPFNYNDSFAGLPYPSLQMWASRGCPYRCNFCVWPQVIYSSTKYRVRDPKDVVDEMQELVERYGYKSVYFDDDTFNIGKERMLAIAAEIKSRGLTIPWGAMARADTSDYETLKALREAGLYAIKFGVESGVQQIVDNCQKNLDLKKVVRTVHWCKELDIKTHLTFTFGLTGETRETADETIRWAVELNPDSAQFSITTPFPGTSYFEHLSQKGLILNTNWEDYDGGKTSVMVSDSLPPEELERVLHRANRIWGEHRRVQESRRH